MGHGHRKPNMPDLSLRIIDAGRLQLLNILGAGAYGTVYRARDRNVVGDTSVFYAVKVQPLIRHKLGSDTAQTREVAVHKEAGVHENVLTVHRVMEDEDYIYIVMDFCAGGDMFDVVARTHGFARNNDLIRSVIVQIIDALHSCHEKSIYHRDLKPENILLNKERNHLYLADFGLASRNISSDSYGAGSSFYMSPECANSRRVNTPYNTAVSDVWSVGIILVNLITGRGPWNRASLEDSSYAEYLHNPDFLRGMLPISRSADRVLRRVLADDPEKRIDLPSLRRLVEEVDNFYMSEEDIAASSKALRDAWNAYYPKEIISPLPVTMGLDCHSWMESDSSFASSDGSESFSFTHSSSSGSASGPFVPPTAEVLFALQTESSSDDLSLLDEELLPRRPLRVCNPSPSTGSDSSEEYYPDSESSNGRDSEESEFEIHNTVTLEADSQVFLETHSSSGAENGTESSESGSCESRSSDEEESSGPETPETYARDVVAASSILEPEDMELGDALYPHTKVDEKKESLDTSEPMVHRIVDDLLTM